MLAIAVVVAIGVAPGCDERPHQLHVGRIIIEGNSTTLDGDILDELPLYPGAVLPTEADLLRAEMRLLLAFHKRFDLADRRRPRIEFEKSEFESEFVDIHVLFLEKKRKRR